MQVPLPDVFAIEWTTIANALSLMDLCSHRGKYTEFCSRFCILQHLHHKLRSGNRRDTHKICRWHEAGTIASTSEFKRILIEHLFLSSEVFIDKKGKILHFGKKTTTDAQVQDGSSLIEVKIRLMRGIWVFWNDHN